MIAGKHYIDFLSINLLNITLLIFSTFFVDCSSENIKQIYKFSKEKEIKLNFPDGEIIGKIFDLLEHDNKFYLVDNQSHKIWVTDQKGQLLRTIGRKGQGPGDLNGPVSIALKGDTLLVLEKENSRISLFNNSGTFISQFPVMSGMLSSMEINRDGKKIIIGESLGIWDYKFYSINGKEINISPKSERTQILMPASISGGQISLTKDDNILFSCIRKYNIIMLNWNGDTLKSFSATPHHYITPPLNDRKKLMKQKFLSLVILPLQITDVILVQRFNKFLNINSNSKKEENEFYYDLFSSDGKLFAEGIKCEYPYFLYQKNGFLYTMDYTPLEQGNDNPSILVFKLQKL